MKNALILSGEYRTFDLTRDSIQKFIEENNLDVYCHLWSTNEAEAYHIISKLKPKGFLIEDPSIKHERFLEIESIVKTKNPKVLRTPDRIAGMTSMHYSRRKAYELVDTYYDNFIYARYDLLFNEIFKVKHVEHVITPTAEAWGVISDIFAIIPNKYANDYFLYEKIVDLQSTKFEDSFINFLRNDFKYSQSDIKIHNTQRYCPHMMLLRNFVLNNTPFEIRNLPVSLQRR